MCLGSRCNLDGESIQEKCQSGSVLNFKFTITFTNKEEFAWDDRITWFAVTDPIVSLVTGIEVLVLGTPIWDVERLSVLERRKRVIMSVIVGMNNGSNCHALDPSGS